MDGGAWWAAVHGVAKSRTWPSDLTFTFHFHALEKEMATHTSVPAWRIPGTGEPGGLPSVGLHRVGHAWSNLAAVMPRAWFKKTKGRHKTETTPPYSPPLKCKHLSVFCQLVESTQLGRKREARDGLRKQFPLLLCTIAICFVWSFIAE